MAELSLQADSVRNNPTRFDRAVSRYLYALERLHAETDLSNEANDFLTDALIAAEQGVISEPAESIEDLRTKADVFLDAERVLSESDVSEFFADLIRLSGGGVSRVFDPARWLARFEKLGGGWVVRDGAVIFLRPDRGERLDGLFAELTDRAGRSAVEALILTRAA